MPWDKDALAQRRMGAGLQGIGLGLGRLWRPGYVDVERLVVGRCQPARYAGECARVLAQVSVVRIMSAVRTGELGASGIIVADELAAKSVCRDEVEFSVRLHGGILSGSMKRPTPATLAAAGVFEDYWMHEMGYRGLGSGSGRATPTRRDWP